MQHRGEPSEDRLATVRSASAQYAQPCLLPAPEERRETALQGLGHILELAISRLDETVEIRHFGAQRVGQFCAEGGSLGGQVISVSSLGRPELAERHADGREPDCSVT